MKRQIHIKNNLVNHKLDNLIDKNIELLTKEVNFIGNTIFSDYLENLQDVILTDEVLLVGEKLDVQLNEEANGTLAKLKNNKYCIVLNYNRIVLDNGKLDLYVKNIIYHEFQHLKDAHYDSFFTRTTNSIKEENERIIGMMFFKEFNASYRAQLYEPIVWRTNYYGVADFIDWCKDNIYNIRTEINEYKNIFQIRSDLERMVEQVQNFNRAVMYKLALACGANCGDNVIKSGEKRITLLINGIDWEIDEYINSYINGLNEALDDDKKIICYAADNCMGIYDILNKFFIKKINALQK